MFRTILGAVVSLGSEGYLLRRVLRGCHLRKEEVLPCLGGF